MWAEEGPICGSLQPCSVATCPVVVAPVAGLQALGLCLKVAVGGLLPGMRGAGLRFALEALTCSSHGPGNQKPWVLAPALTVSGLGQGSPPGWVPHPLCKMGAGDGLVAESLGPCAAVRL